MRIARSLTAAGALLAAVIPSPSAAFTVSVTGVQFGEVIDWYEPNDPTGAGATGLGQVMNIEWTGDVYVVELLMSRRSTTTQGFVVEIHAGDPTGPLLASSESIPASEVPVEPMTDWVQVRFPDPAPVDAGEDYAVVMPPGPDTAAADPAYAWVSDDSDWSGAAWLSSTSGWTHDASGPWTATDPVLHRAARVHVSESVRCRVHFVHDGGPVTDIGPTITARVGEPLEFAFIDFQPSATAVATMTHEQSGRTLLLEAQTDLTGRGSLVHTFAADDLGDWTVTGSHADGAACPDADDRPSRLNVDFLPQPTPTVPPVPDTSLNPLRPGPDAMEGIAFAGISLVAASVVIAARRRGRSLRIRGAVRRRAG